MESVKITNTTAIFAIIRTILNRILAIVLLLFFAAFLTLFYCQQMVSKHFIHARLFGFFFVHLKTKIHHFTEKGCIFGRYISNNLVCIKHFRRYGIANVVIIIINIFKCFSTVN